MTIQAHLFHEYFTVACQVRRMNRQLKGQRLTVNQRKNWHKKLEAAQDRLEHLRQMETSLSILSEVEGLIHEVVTLYRKVEECSPQEGKNCGGLVMELYEVADLLFDQKIHKALSRLEVIKPRLEPEERRLLEFATSPEQLFVTVLEIADGDAQVPEGHGDSAASAVGEMS